MPAADLLFVYGTLRRGGSNDIARIAPAATWAGTARIRGRLFDVNGRWPALVLDAAAGWVVGELYQVPKAAWPALDALEDPVRPDHPDGAYFKVVAPVEHADRVLQATVYTANPAVTPLMTWIESGDWMAYVAAMPSARRKAVKGPP